jgi:fumarate hydratase subunit beta
MDPYTPTLLKHGVKGFIGKGYRSPEIKQALVKHQAIYLATIGGAAALIAQCIKTSQVVAYPDLGTEAIYEFFVEEFPAVVVNDIYGHDIYVNGQNLYRVN